MPLESLYFDLTLKKWVRGFDDPSDADLPVFGHTDSRDFGITFLRRVTVRTVQVVDATVGAVIALTDPASPTNLLCQATAGGAVQNEYPFVLNLSSANMTSFMNGVTSSPKACDCQIKLSTSNGPSRFDTKIFIASTKVPDVAVDSAAADRALGFDEAKGIYIPKEWPAGMRMVMVSDSGRRFLFYPHDDGSFRGDEI